MPGLSHAQRRDLFSLTSWMTCRFAFAFLLACAAILQTPGTAFSSEKNTPHILSTSPAQNELDVSVAADISVSFDADMDESTINDSTLTAHGKLTGLLEGTITYNSQTRTATLVPYDHFDHGEVVTVVLTNGVQSSEGFPLASSHIWSFTAEATDGPGSFAPYSPYVVADGPQSVFAADLDGDGTLDLATANWFSNTVSVLLNNGDGTFSAHVDYPTGSSPFSVIAADFDSDGHIDLAAANSFSSNVSILLNTGAGVFSPDSIYPVGIRPYSVTSADLDGDGDLDLATANEIANTVSILLNNGDATFSSSVHYATGSNPASVSSGDLDGDGDLDLVTANQVSNDVSVLLNYGDGTFASHLDYPASARPFSVFSADLNGDGDVDLITANLNVDSVSVLLGSGDGAFPGHTEYAVGGTSRSVSATDLDGDGDLDLATANQMADNVSVLFNNGDGSFSPHVEYSTGDSPVSLFAADLDGDGDLDLATANVEADNLCVLMNELLSDCTLWASPDTVIVGQTIALSMRVENTGSVYADSVVPSINLLGDGGVVPDSGPIPAFADIAPGSDALFSWTFSSEDVHFVYWEGYASGRDRGTGNVITSPQDTSSPVLIQSPPDLAFVINSLEPDTLTVGQTSAYVVTIRNDGEAWFKLAPQSTFRFSDAGGETLRAHLIDSTLVDGLVEDRVLEFDSVTVSEDMMDGDWQSWLSIEGIGRNGYTHSFTLPGDMVTIQQKAEVEEIVATLTPDQVSQGQSVAFSVEVFNAGGVGVILDATSRFSFTDGADTYESFLEGEDTVNVGTLRILTLTSDTIPQAMREGKYPITLCLKGHDLNGAEYSDTVGTGGNEVTVQTPACLEGLVTMVSADTVYWGQKNVSVDVVVRNGGGADALIDSTNLKFARGMSNIDDEYEQIPLSSIDTLPGYSSEIVHFRVSVQEQATEGWVTVHLRIFGRDANSAAPVFDTTTAFPDSFCVFSYRCGDCNGDENISVADAIYLVTYIYRNGSAPLGPGDVNSDAVVSIADAIYLIAYIYREGSPLCNPPGSTTPFRSQRMER